MTVAFTGYRPEKMPFTERDNDPDFVKFKEKLTETVGKLVMTGYDTFLSGMATGFDTWAAEAVLSCRRRYPEVSLVGVIPFPEQAADWSGEDRYRREMILRGCTSSVIISPAYARGCYFTRNRYLVDHADLLLCAYDGQKGGTAYTVDYAKKRGLPLICIRPSTAEVLYYRLPPL